MLPRLSYTISLHEPSANETLTGRPFSSYEYFTFLPKASVVSKTIGCSPTTVSNEIKRGTILMYKNYAPHYRAKAGSFI